MSLFNAYSNDNPEFKYTRENENELLDIIFSELKRNYKGTPLSVGLLFNDLKVRNYDGGTTEDFSSRIEAIIVNSGLVTITNGTKSASVQFKLSSTGLILLEEHGSYSNYMLAKLKKQERQEIIERLAFDSLQSSVYKLERELEDYSTTKNMAKYSMWIAIFASALTAIGLMKQC